MREGREREREREKDDTGLRGRRSKQRSPEVEEGEVEAGTRTSRFEARLQLYKDARSGLDRRRPGSRQRMLAPAAYHRYPLQLFAAELGGLATACQRQPGPPAGIGMRLAEKGWQGGSLGGGGTAARLAGVEWEVWKCGIPQGKSTLRVFPAFCEPTRVVVQVRNSVVTRLPLPAYRSSRQDCYSYFCRRVPPFTTTAFSIARHPE